MVAWGWGTGGEAWMRWRRLWMWEEEMLVECRNLLLYVMLHVDINDAWRWTPYPVVGYIVSGVYHILTARSFLINHVLATLL